MAEEMLTQVITQGAFAVLFVWLLINTRKEAKEREAELHKLIEKLADSFKIVQDIKEDVDTIKKKIFEGET